MANKAFNPVIYTLQTPEQAFAATRGGVTYDAVAPKSFNHTSKDNLWVVTGKNASGYINTPLSRAHGSADIVNRKGVVSLLPKTTYPYSSGEPIRYAEAVGTNVYLFGSSGMWLYDLEKLSYSTLSVTQSADRTDAASCVVGTKIYLIGGKENNAYCKNIKVFNTANNTFSTLNGGFSDRYPYGCVGATAVAIGTKIYIFGGAGDNATYDILSGVAVFDTAKSTCTRVDVTCTDKALSQATLTYAASAVVGSKVYLFGDNYANRIGIFDTASNEYTFLNDVFPADPYTYGEVCDMSAAVIEDKVYLFGGSGSVRSGGYNYDAVSVFDTKTNTLSIVDAKLPKSLNRIMAIANGKRAYLFGGDSSNKYSRLIVFTTGALYQNTLYVKTSEAKTPVLLYVSDQIELRAGVEAVYLGNENDEAVKVDAYTFDPTTKEWKLIT